MTSTDTTTGTLAHIDPTSIVLDTNVRTTARLDDAFVASIREHGVMQPVVGYQDDDGVVHVLQGQRRTLAAIQAERPTIPVYLAHSPAEADRIITQMIENDQRSGLGDAERADAYEQLAVLGMSASQIARRAHVTKEAVEHGLAARSAESGREALAAGLSLDDAAVLAEFEGDDDAIAALLDAAERDSIAHEASRLRRHRAAAQALATAQQDLTEQGIAVLDEAPWGYFYDGHGPAAPLRHLDVDEEQHTTCPGHAVLLSASAWGDEPTVSTTTLCTAWKEHGHSVTGPYANTATSGGPMTDDEKAERRTIVENNKAWRAATDVRRTWLATFAQRKTAPKDAPVFLAHALAGRRAEDGTTDRKGITTELLGTGWRAIPATPAKAMVRALGIALAGHEVTYADVHTWRHVDAATLLYLRTITAWGYQPSEVEQAILDNAAETADDEE